MYGAPVLSCPSLWGSGSTGAEFSFMVSSSSLKPTKPCAAPSTASLHHLLSHTRPDTSMPAPGSNAAREGLRPGGVGEQCGADALTHGLERNQLRFPDLGLEGVDADGFIRRLRQRIGRPAGHRPHNGTRRLS